MVIKQTLIALTKSQPKRSAEKPGLFNYQIPQTTNRPSLTTVAVGEEDNAAPPKVTTAAVGEEDGGIMPAKPLQVTTAAIGEEDGGLRPPTTGGITTMAVGEEH